MAELIIRPYSGGDAVAVTALVNAVLAAGGLTRTFTEDNIRSRFGRSGDPADTRLVFTTDGTLAAAGQVDAPDPGGARAIALGGVCPAWRGQGLGRALLAWQFERVAAMRAARAAGAREPLWLIQTQAGQADSSAARLFRRLGLGPARHFLSMRAATAGQRTAPVPAGLAVASFSAGLHAALHAAHQEAFADHWGHEYSDPVTWAAWTTSHPMFRPDLTRIGLDGGEVAGYALAYGAPGSVYYGQVGTRRPWRGRGLASALLAGSLAAAAAAGLPDAALDVDATSPTGAVAVYQRLGFIADPAASVFYEAAL